MRKGRESGMYMYCVCMLTRNRISMSVPKKLIFHQHDLYMPHKYLENRIPVHNTCILGDLLHHYGIVLN